MGSNLRRKLVDGVPEDMLPDTLHEMNNYGTLKIVEYINYREVTVEFVDTGYRVSHVRAGNIRSGRVRDTSVVPEDMLPDTLHEMNNYGTLKIVEYINNAEVTVEFVDTGYRVSHVRAGSIRGGEVKDLLKPSVCNIGYLGSPETPTQDSEGYPLSAYSTWQNILFRCYVKSSKSFPMYGARGVRVSEEWKNYSIFKKYYDENYIEGYHLDKDKYSTCNGKLYSEDDCRFISVQENAEEANAKHWLILTPEEELICVYNLVKFARGHEVKSTPLHSALTGQREQYKGYKQPSPQQFKQYRKEHPDSPLLHNDPAVAGLLKETFS